MDVEVEHPQVHHPVGHRRLDLVLPIAALFVSLLSIFLAWDNGKVMQDLVNQNERLVQANSLPHISQGIRTLTRANGMGHIQFEVTNNGIGPAEIRSAELVVDGRPLRGPNELLQRFGIPGGELSTATVTNSMVRPGQTLTYFDLNANPQIAAGVDRMIALTHAERIFARICYCSVFDECWVVNERTRRPLKVEQCPMPAVPYE